MLRILFFCIVGVLTISCNSDECSGREDRSLDPNAINTIPYVGGQEYEFVSSDGALIKTWVEKIEETLLPDFPLICEGYLELRFKKEDGELFMDILMRGTGEANLVQVSIFEYGMENGVIAQYQVNEDGSLSGVLPHDTYTFHESIMIDDQSYLDVIELNYPEFEEENDVDQLFYNADVGLIKLVSKDGYSITHL